MAEVSSTSTTSTQKKQSPRFPNLVDSETSGVDRNVFVVSVEMLLNEEKAFHVDLLNSIIALGRTFPSLALIAAPS